MYSAFGKITVRSLDEVLFATRIVIFSSCPNAFLENPMFFTLPLKNHAHKDVQMSMH